jgi:hypothetical protein
VKSPPSPLLPVIQGVSLSATNVPPRDPVSRMPQRTPALFTTGDRVVPIDPSSLRRFTATVPRLRRLLQSSEGCDRELLLRSAMRRTLRELAEAFSHAAGAEASPVRAEQLRALSKVATQLAHTALQ